MMTLDEFLDLINPKQIYTVRFWNVANECMNIDGLYMHSFDSYENAWNGAVAMLERAYNLGAVEMDINNEFFDIVNDNHVRSSDR